MGSTGNLKLGDNRQQGPRHRRTNKFLHEGQMSILIQLLCALKRCSGVQRLWLEGQGGFAPLKLKHFQLLDVQCKPQVCLLFTHESSYCFQCVLAIAILSVHPSIRPSVTRVDQSKTVQARITTSSPSGTVVVIMEPQQYQY